MEISNNKPNLYSLYFEGKSYGEYVDVPVYDDQGHSVGKIYFQLLSSHDANEVRREAHLMSQHILEKQLKNKTVSDAGALYEEIYNAEVSKLSLFRCLKDPEDITKPLFPDPETMSKRLLPDQVNYFNTIFTTLQNKKSGLYNNVNHQTFEDILKQLMEDIESTPLFLSSRMPPDTQLRFTLFLVSQLFNLQKNNSSASSPSKS